MYPKLIAFASLLLLAGCSTSSQTQRKHAEEKHKAPSASSLIGSFTFTSGSEPHDVELAVTISRSGSTYSLDLQAWHPDAHGAAPDGGGVGHVDAAGVLRFTYEDSFSNRGTGTFRPSPKGYQLSIEIDEVSDPRCLMFYGDFTLQRAKSKGRSP